MECIKNWHDTVVTVETLWLTTTVSTVSSVSLKKNTPFIMPEFDSDTTKSLVVLIYS